jgi:Leucine-rich repeat (LRR) protein
VPACLQGCHAQLQAALPSLTELDLSDNLVASWAFVEELTAALPSLAALNLSRNRLALRSLAHVATAPLPPLAGLRTLVLNACGVEWQQAVAVAPALPSLQELHLCGNRIPSLQLPDSVRPQGALPAAGSSGSSVGGAGTGSSGGSESPRCTASLLAAAFPSLEVLDLEDNCLCSWADVALLRTLPRLRSLLLSGNQLTEVRYSGGTGSAPLGYRTGLHAAAPMCAPPCLSS